MKHWAEEDFINFLYDAGQKTDHLDECEDCRNRFRIWLDARLRGLAKNQIPSGVLQRPRPTAATFELEEGQTLPKWTHAAAILIAAFISLLLWKRPFHDLAETRPEANVMTDLYFSAFEPEPFVADFVRAMFEEGK